MSSSPSPVLSAEQRAWRYWFDDGLPILLTGIGFLLGALLFSNDHSENSTPLTISVCLGALLLYCALLIFQRQIIDWLKSKITYPRTGYVHPPHFEQAPERLDGEEQRPAELEVLHEYRKQRILLTCAAVGAASFAMVYIQNRWTCTVAGFVIAMALWLWARKVYRLSWIVIGGLPFIGFFLSVVIADRFHGYDRITYFLFAVGALLVVDGTLTLVRYLRRNPRPAQSES